MTEVHEHLVDLFVAVIIVFLFPVLYFGLKQEALIQSIVAVETNALVSEVRSKAYLTREKYDQYLERLSATGLTYDIAIDHRRRNTQPEYRLRTPEEVMEEQNHSFTGENYYRYRPISTEIPAVSDPVLGGPLNTETNESVLASAANTPPSPTHIHTDDCYLGTRHVHEGNTTNGGICYSWNGHTHTGSCAKTWVTLYVFVEQVSNYQLGTCEGNPIMGTYSVHRCMLCGAQSRWEWGDCIDCGQHFMYKLGGCACGYWDYSCGQAGSYQLTCTKTEGHYYNGNLEAFPVCDQIVSSIVPTHSTQTVAAGEPLITTVTAVYRDGSTRVVLGSSTYSTSNPVHSQTVAISYSYMLNGVPRSKTCSITVTVIPKSRTCLNSHTYNLNVDGSDPGCPYCRSWLASLVIACPSTGSITIDKGTTLQENGVALLATYMDGHIQQLPTEYIDNLDREYVGNQNVTISYKGKYVKLTVITKRNLQLCSVCSRYYELYPDGSDPGCPYCMALTPIFTGKVLEYYDVKYTNTILGELYEGSGTYYFSSRDYVSIKINNNQGGLGRRLISYIYKNMGVTTMQSVKSGYIREDGWK